MMVMQRVSGPVFSGWAPGCCSLATSGCPFSSLPSAGKVLDRRQEEYNGNATCMTLYRIGYRRRTL